MGLYGIGAGYAILLAYHAWLMWMHADWGVIFAAVGEWFQFKRC